MIAKVLSRIGIEVWKDIPEFEGIYQVSNLGNVKSIRNNKIKRNFRYPINRFFTLFFKRVGINKRLKANAHNRL